MLLARGPQVRYDAARGMRSHTLPASFRVAGVCSSPNGASGGEGGGRPGPAAPPNRGVVAWRGVADEPVITYTDLHGVLGASGSCPAVLTRLSASFGLPAGQRPIHLATDFGGSSQQDDHRWRLALQHQADRQQGGHGHAPRPRTVDAHALLVLRSPPGLLRLLRRARIACCVSDTAQLASRSSGSIVRVGLPGAL